MKAKINLKPNSNGRPGYYGFIEDEATYEGVKEGRLSWEKTKRVTHYLLPQNVFVRLLELDKASEKMCGHWVYEPDDNGVVKPRCSCCKVEAKNELNLTNFCPECGADLREVSIDTEGET